MQGLKVRFFHECFLLNEPKASEVIARVEKPHRNPCIDELKKKEVECPLNKSELGNQTWGFLHTMAAYFPDKPSADNQRDMVQFLKLFSKFYPCPTCARDFSKLIEKEPPRTSSQIELKHWLCWAHNQVNKKLGKPKFDCSKLDERWKYGWKDGSCDV